MLTVALVNLPLAPAEVPSIGLTQIRAAAVRRLGATVTIDIHYVNQEFAQMLGFDRYRELAEGNTWTGLGDWFFRPAAFPEEPDNTDEYLGQFGIQPTDPRISDLLEIRRGISGWIAQAARARQLVTADVVGFTSMFSQNTAVLGMARYLKQVNPGVITMIGGANCEDPMGRVLAARAPQLDLVFSGPGTESFPEVLSRIVSGHAGRMPARLAAGIPGVLAGAPHSRPVRTVEAGGYPGQAGPGRARVLVSVGPRPDEQREIAGQETPIDGGPLVLDYDSFLEDWEERLGGTGREPTLLIETSRGCWWGQRHHCTFCGLNGTGMWFRSMAAERALDEINRAAGYYPRCRRIASVDNIMPHNYLTDLLPHVRLPPDVTLFYEVKANLRRGDVATLAKAGVRHVQPGVEALSTPVLKLMRKGTTAAQNVALLRYCAAYRVFPSWNLLIGFPGECEDYYAEYLRFLPALFHLPPPSGVYPVRFDRFSPYFTDPDAFGLELRPAPFYRLVYPFPEADLRDLAYFFHDVRGSQPFKQNVARWLSPLRDIVSAWRARWGNADSWDFPDRPVLRLSRAGAGWQMTDTRGGRPLVTPVDSRQFALLRECDRPRSRASLAADTGLLDDMVSASWIFADDDRVVSLVDAGGPA